MRQTQCDLKSARHFYSCDAVTAELYRRHLFDRYRSCGTVRQQQLSSALGFVPYKQPATDGAP